MPDRLDLGELRSGDVREFSVQIVNHSYTTIHIIGAKNGCACIVPQGIPAEIAPRSRWKIRLAFHVQADNLKPMKVRYSIRLLSAELGWLHDVTVNASIASSETDRRRALEPVPFS